MHKKRYTGSRVANVLSASLMYGSLRQWCAALINARSTRPRWARDVFGGQRVVYPLLVTSHKEAHRRGQVAATAAMAMVVK